MKTVTIQKRKNGLYGWYLPKNTTVSCQCIYAKLTGKDIGYTKLAEEIEKTYPYDNQKVRETYGLIRLFDTSIASTNDIENLKRLAKILEMRVVIKRK